MTQDILQFNTIPSPGRPILKTHSPMNILECCHCVLTPPTPTRPNKPYFSSRKKELKRKVCHLCTCRLTTKLLLYCCVAAYCMSAMSCDVQWIMHDCAKLFDVVCLSPSLCQPPPGHTGLQLHDQEDGCISIKTYRHAHKRCLDW